MPLEVTVEEEKLNGFTTQAREQLKVSLQTYALGLVAEAERIEAGRNAHSDNPEITQVMVRDAAVIMTHGLSKKKTSWWAVISRIAGAVMPLIVGILYNTQSLQQPWYMAMYVIFVALAVIAVTASVLVE